MYTYEAGCRPKAQLTVRRTESAALREPSGREGNPAQCVFTFWRCSPQARPTGTS
jgi:hypothetical protein